MATEISLKEWVDNHPLAPHCSLGSGLADMPFDNPAHNEIVSRIKKAYRKAKKDQPLTNPDYLPNALWAEGIDVHRKDLVEALNREDESFGEKIKNFWRTQWIRGLSKYGLFNAVSCDMSYHLYYKSRILRDISVWVEYLNRPANIRSLAIPPAGNPFGLKVYDTLITGCSLHNSYYANKFKDILVGHSHPRVFELGGGIGVMAYYLLNESNDCLRYFGFDLPEIQVLAQYFLMSAMPDFSFQLYGEDENYGANVTLLPYYCLDEMTDGEADLFVNIHSLSEMTEKAVSAYMKQITRITDMYFFSENAHVTQEYNESVVEKADMSGFTRLQKSPNIWGENVYREHLYKRI